MLNFSLTMLYVCRKSLKKNRMNHVTVIEIVYVFTVCNLRLIMMTQCCFISIKMYPKKKKHVLKVCMSLSKAMYQLRSWL